ncbi:collagen a1 [Salinibacter ruber DSM 13855]|uniref:Collagen a1 n=1 Tax=Salinibacter ruber (strain DSM 13855 / M31) TaxID=309807 RepID=Q2S5W1_SALRD|nr:collagen a1 [Salinibacter ruber DSM 13855]
MVAAVEPQLAPLRSRSPTSIAASAGRRKHMGGRGGLVADEGESERTTRRGASPSEEVRRHGVREAATQAGADGRRFGTENNPGRVGAPQREECCSLLAGSRGEKGNEPTRGPGSLHLHLVADVQQVLGDGGGDGPEVDRFLSDLARAEVDDPVRLPVAHPKVVRDDPVPRVQCPEQLRAQLHVDLRPQVQGHDRRLAQVGLKQVSLPKLDQVGDPGRLRVLAGLGDQLRIDLDADAAGAVSLGGGNRDAPVAATEVDHHVVAGHLGRLEHPVHNALRRGDVRDVLLDGVRVGDDRRLGQRLLLQDRRERVHGLTGSPQGQNGPEHEEGRGERNRYGTQTRHCRGSENDRQKSASEKRDWGHRADRPDIAFPKRGGRTDRSRPSDARRAGQDGQPMGRVAVRAPLPGARPKTGARPPAPGERITEK